MLRRLLIPLASAALAAAALSPQAARASATQESIFQDEHALLYSGDAVRQRTLDEIKWLGATTVHTIVYWDSVAPDHTSRGRPRFDARDPNAYPPGAWSTYDALVSEARARGLRLIMSPTRAPAWAGRCGRTAIRNHCGINPNMYRDFVEALARRYPSVHRWSFWNEPNQARVLQPQQVRKHGHVLPWAAVMYRNLLRSGIAALRATGHGGDQVLLGETAPLGQRTASLALRSLTPVAFYQGLFCLDSHGHPLRGRVARDMHCSGRYAPLAVSGVAHHPYSRAGSQPPTARPGSGEITFATLSRLSGVIDQGARAHRIPRRLPFYFTEVGWQTNPPDRLLGVSLSAQARYINEGDWISYRRGRVRSVAQYELFDDTALGSFQSGLRFANGRRKPSLDAYRLPIWVSRTRSGVDVWGQVRPADGTPQIVRIQNGARRFRTVRTVRTAASGYFEVRLRRRPGPKWRLLWSNNGHNYYSRIAGVG